MEFSVLREMKGCKIWDEVEETRMMEEQEEKGQHVQDVLQGSWWHCKGPY